MGVILKTVKDCVKTKKYLTWLLNDPYLEALQQYGDQGVQALASATPKDSGKTAASWHYEIDMSSGRTAIRWYNDNLTRDGDPIAILLQYGHGTGTGGYVQGRDYINPAIQPIFDIIEEGVWKVVTDHE